MNGELEGAGAALDRRRFLQSAGGVAAAAGLAGSLGWPQGATAHRGNHHHLGKRHAVPLPAPKPIPGGIINGAFHVFGPGPESVTLPFSAGTLQGLNVEPTPILDYAGFSALAYHAGTATGSDGKDYNLETDIRAFRGRYVGSDGSRRFGTFALI